MNTNSVNNYRTRNTIRNVIYGFSNRFLTVALPFFVRTIVLYKLGSEYVGLGSLFTSILQVLSVAELGFSSAIAYSLYEPVAKGDKQSILDLARLLKSVYLIVGGVILIAGCTLLPLVRFFIKDEVPNNLNVYILFMIYLINTVISYFFYGYKVSLLTAYQRQDLVSKVGMAIEAIKGIAQVLVLLLFSNYYLYVVILPICTLFSNIFVNVICNHYYPDLNIHLPFSLNGIKNMVKQIGGIAIGRVSLMCRNSFDCIIISTLFGLTTVAIYSNYYLIFSSIMGFMAVLIISMTASVGNSLVTETMAKNESDHLKFDMFYEIIVSFCTICLFCLYQPFMKLWVGEQLLFPKFTMILFCIYFYVNNLAQVRSAYSEAAGLWWDFRYLTITEMIANLLLNIVLGIYFGVNGILIATIITAFLGSFIGCTVITYKRLFHTSSVVFYFRNMLYAIVSLCGCAIVYRITNLVTLSSFLGFGTKVMVCGCSAAAFLSIVYLTIPMTRREIKQFICKKVF